MDILYEWYCSKYCRAGVNKIPAKDQTVNILGFVGHMVSITTTQLSHSSTKAARENEWMNEWICIYGDVPIKIYLQKQMTDQIWCAGHS